MPPTGGDVFACTKFTESDIERLLLKVGKEKSSPSRPSASLQRFRLSARRLIQTGSQTVSASVKAEDLRDQYIELAKRAAEAVKQKQSDLEAARTKEVGFFQFEAKKQKEETVKEAEKSLQHAELWSRIQSGARDLSRDAATAAAQKVLARQRKVAHQMAVRTAPLVPSITTAIDTTQVSLAVKQYREGKALLPWTGDEVALLVTGARASLAAPAYSAAFATMFTEWVYLFERVLDEAAKGFVNFDKVLAGYVAKADERKALMIKIFTGLFSVGLGAVLGPLGGVVSEFVVKAVAKGIEKGLAAIQEKVSAKGAEALAGKVEAKLIDDKLNELRKRSEIGSSFEGKIDEIMAAIKGEVLDVLRTNQGKVLEALKAIDYLDSADARALLRVLMQEAHLEDMIINPEVSPVAIHHQMGGVFSRAEAYYQDLGALVLKKVYDKHRMKKAINKGTLSGFQKELEKWIWAQYIGMIAPDAEAKHFKGLTGYRGFTDELQRLGVLQYREKRFFSENTLSDTEKVAQLAAAKRGESFTVGGRDVGSGARERIHAWAGFTKRQSPIEKILQ